MLFPSVARAALPLYSDTFCYSRLEMEFQGIGVLHHYHIHHGSKYPPLLFFSMFPADFYSREAKAIFEKIGSPDLTLNCLRHTCATNMVYLKIPVDFRKHIMGHSTTIITDRVYTHIEMGVSKEKIEKLYPNLYFTKF